MREITKEDIKRYISFPPQEIDNYQAMLSSNGHAYTTRAEAEIDKYKKGDKLHSQFGEITVEDVKRITGKHPFDKNLSDEQREYLKDKEYDLVKFKKTADYAPMHTRTLGSVTYDVFKLFDIASQKEPVMIDLPKANRQKRTGFSKIRYENADLSFPIIVNEDGVILDGRHRVAKSIDSGAKNIKAVVLSNEEIANAELKVIE
jgi:hypothetical protein